MLCFRVFANSQATVTNVAIPTHDVSKQKLLNPSRTNTCKKQASGGPLSPTKALHSILPLAAVFLLLCPPNSTGQPQDSAIAARRFQHHLRHGINLSEWFAQVYDPRGYSKEHFESWNSAQDIALIKAIDFDHVRLSVNPKPMFRVMGLPYPASDQDAIGKIAAAVPDPVKRLAVVRYGADHWNAARVDVEFDQVVAWAKRWDVPVVCNEFGVYRKAANPADRANWIADVRKGLEKRAIGWTMWDYSGGFGVVTKEKCQATPDEITIKALGRTMPSQTR
jgi:hypothetical protein